MSKTWFITGASRGFGRLWSQAALERGDRVAATARDTATLKDLAEAYGDAVLPLQLDVTDRAACRETVQQAHDRFGRLDVLVNNAGYGHFGFAEELTEQEARAQLETNFFGALWTTQAAIPLMRAQGSGHLVHVSSLAGAVAFPGLSMYHASKWALEGMAESVAGEVAGFGIRTTIIEPGGYSTDWGADSAARSEGIDLYDEVRELIAAGAHPSAQPDPSLTVPAVLAAVDADEPPLRLLLGSFAFDMVVPIVERRVQDWRAWEDLSRSASPS
ncbi:MAG TPA: SDR family NAD(P)-dependent oxidoreductase [Egibacteraceae bacterium]|nr:SDR family NAD(P)-dependent oxidoreductase [Egibacteraceae bacterium]